MSVGDRKPLYTADDLAGGGFDARRALGAPGEYPFTRGIHPTMYRGKLWTMRQFAGFGSASDTNRRYKFLLEHGQTGLSVAFDFPTLMGYDSDHARSEGEVGKCGVAISSLADMEDDQRPGGDSLLLLRRRRREAGCADRQAARDGAERHSQGVHGPARLGVSGRAGSQSHRRHVRVGCQAHAALEYDFDLGLSH